MRVKKFGASFEVTDSKNKSFWTDVYNVWENDTFNYIMKYLDKDKTFVDIGAWIGPISLVACQYSKKCICFEPDELAYGEFMNNISINNINNITLENRAISIHSTIKLGATQLGESITREDCSENSKIYECKTVRDIFSEYNLTENSVSVIKIDVEGHESELLQDRFLWDLNVPMHISLHPGWKSDKEKYYRDILPFFEHKKIDISNFNPRDFFDVEVN